MTTQGLAVPAAARPVLTTLAQAGYQAYVVGGAVRDLLLGKGLKDIDIATDAHPDVVQQLFDRTLATGLRHGTVTVITPAGARCEVTTFRSDGPYLDGRRPLFVEYSTRIEDDLSRRDFTINAMALALDGTLVDPFAGQMHLREKRLVAVGNPDLRFREDGLRLLRAIRFVASYRLQVAPATMTALVRQAHRVNSVSRERIGQELFKLSQADWLFALPTILQSGLFARMEPPLNALHDGFAWLSHWYAKAKRPPVPKKTPVGLPALAVWLVGLADGPQRLERLCRLTGMGKSAGQQARQIGELARVCLRDPHAAFAPEQLYQYGRETAGEALALAAWLQPEQAEAYAKALAQAVRVQPLWRIQDLAISGRDIRRLGAIGKDIGDILAALVADVLHRRVMNTPDALLARAAALLDSKKKGDESI